VCAHVTDSWTKAQGSLVTRGGHEPQESDGPPQSPGPCKPRAQKRIKSGSPESGQEHKAPCRSMLDAALGVRAAPGWAATPAQSSTGRTTR